jgi:hypothetical protein
MPLVPHLKKLRDLKRIWTEKNNLKGKGMKIKALEGLHSHMELCCNLCVFTTLRFCPWQAFPA